MSAPVSNVDRQTEALAAWLPGACATDAEAIVILARGLLFLLEGRALEDWPAPVYRLYLALNAACDELEAARVDAAAEVVADNGRRRALH